MHIQNKSLLLASVAGRGLLTARAEAPAAAQLVAMIEKVNTTFAEFRAANDQRLAEIEKKGSADPVLAEKVERINAALTEQQRTLEDASKRMAALTLGGGGDVDLPEAREHRAQFSAWLRGRPEARTTTYTDPDGGFLAPATIDTMVTRILSQTLAMRRLAQVQPISAASYVKHKSLGGAGSGWVGESDTGSARPETSTPTLARMEFTPGEIYAEPYSTQQALDDMTVDVEAWLAGEVTITFSEREGAAFLTGDGIKKPRGLLDYPTVANASYAWGSIGYIASGKSAAFASVAPADKILDLQHALKSQYRSGAVWLMNDATLGTARQMKDGSGSYYLWQPDPAGAFGGRFLGSPVEIDDNMPAVAANSVSVLFGDFRRGYLIVDRAGVRILRDPYSAKPYVLFYTTKRVGGGIQDFAAIKGLRFAA
jgi:HK97 family phage major capsid protein